MSDEGFLILADISGFTAFVTATELEHGAQVTGALLEAVMERLAPPLEIQELEGDAVFAIGADRLIDSRRVPTVLLEAFHGFRDLQHRIALDDTCSCRAGRDPRPSTAQESGRRRRLSSLHRAGARARRRGSDRQRHARAFDQLRFSRRHSVLRRGSRAGLETNLRGDDLSGCVMC